MLIPTLATWHFQTPVYPAHKCDKSARYDTDTLDSFLSMTWAREYDSYITQSLRCFQKIRRASTL